MTRYGNRYGNLNDSSPERTYEFGPRGYYGEGYFGQHYSGSYSNMPEKDAASEREEYFDGLTRGYGYGGAYGAYSGDFYGNFYGGDHKRDYGSENHENERRNENRYLSGNTGIRPKRADKRSFDESRSKSNSHERDWFDKTADEISSWFGDEEAERRLRRDEIREMRRNYRGKGPKNYRRSDERIREDVSDWLWYAFDVDATNIEVDVENAEVTLSGTVESRYEKRRAEDIAYDTRGVKEVMNTIRVLNPNQPTGTIPNQ